MTPASFLELLWADKPDPLYILIWVRQGKASHWFQDARSAAEFVRSELGRDVYVGVGLSPRDRGEKNRCASDEIVGLAGMWADFDFTSEAHDQKALPASIQDVLTILPTSMAPSILILTGNGVHAWWLFKEPYIFESDEERKNVARLVRRWHTMFRLRSAAQGWAYDCLSDLARLLRVPGTKNYKNPDNPKEVVTLSQTDHRYNLLDFEDFLDAAGIPDQEAEERGARAWAERFADTHLTINTDARIPQEMLDRWMRNDMRFRNTWLRQRHDLKDKSNSGYDMALACFGTAAGLSDQQIVDLIVHNRAHHGQEQRTRLDYFQRTIAKAAQSVGGLDPPILGAAGAQFAPSTNTTPSPTLSPAAPEGAPIAPPAEQVAQSPIPEGKLDPMAKALLCERISGVLGVQIRRIVKIDGKEPQYRMELAATPGATIDQVDEGRQIEFPNVMKLITYASVRTALAATIGKIIPKMNAKNWEQVAQAMLNACIVEESTEEVEWVGATRLYLQNYLSETSFIASIEGQRVLEQRMPMVHEGKISICASNFQAYVNRTTFQNLSVKALTGMLSALGAKSIRVRGNKFKEQSRWLLPLTEFCPADYVESDSEDR